MVVVVLVVGVFGGVIEVHYQTDSFPEIIVIAGLALFKDALDGPAEIIGHRQERFAQGRLDVEDDLALQDLRLPPPAGAAGGLGEGSVEHFPHSALRTPHSAMVRSRGVNNFFRNPRAYPRICPTRSDMLLDI